LITGHQYTEAQISETIARRKKYKAGGSKKDLKHGLGRRKVELERIMEINSSGISRLRKKVEQLKEKGEDKDMKDLEETKALLKTLEEDHARGQAEYNQLLSLFSEEREKTQQQSQAWNKIAERSRQEQLMMATDGALPTLLPASLRQQVERADPFQRQRTAPKVLWSVKGSQGAGAGAERGAAGDKSAATAAAAASKSKAGGGNGKALLSACMDDPADVDPAFDPLMVASFFLESDGGREDGREDMKKVLSRYLPVPKREGGREGGKVKRTGKRVGMTVGEYMSKVTTVAEGGGGQGGGGMEVE
ncbi:hypothetical protein VYU27_006970, partial [Nannochloropsis oceanica]